MLMGILFVILAVFLSYSIYSGFKYTRMINNIFLSLVYNPVLDFSPSSKGERITILDSSDREIEALFIENKGSGKVLIFCHESGSGKDSWERYAYFFPDLRFHVVSLDFGRKAADDEPNALSQWPTREDVERLLTVIRWSKKAFQEEVDIVLFGVSNGADIAFSASFEDASVKGVIADGLFSMKEIFRDYIRKWAPILVKPNLFGQDYPDWVVNLFTELGFWYSQRRSGRKFVEIEGLLKKKHVPLLMIHGDADDYVPNSHQQFLERLNGTENTIQRLIVPKAKHNQAVLLDTEVYKKCITTFIRQLNQK